MTFLMAYFDDFFDDILLIGKQVLWESVADLSNMSNDLNLDQGDVYKSKYNLADRI